MKKSNRKKTFSIVLPFYNEEDVVEEVVRSLILQCQKNELNVEFVLVNNGSSDKTGEIINRLRSEFSIIKSITRTSSNAQVCCNVTRSCPKVIFEKIYVYRAKLVDF